MVRPWVLGCLAAVALAESARAAPDWRGAGGDIFVGGPTSTSEPQEAVLGPVQLAASRQPFAAQIDAAAAQHRLDPKLLHALVVVESGYRPTAVSPAGAAGLTQIMPATARALGVRDRFDPDANVLAGADYLARQLVRFGDVRLALAAYNAGPMRVAQVGRVPPIAETQQYVARVLDCYLALAAGRTVRTISDCRSVSP